MAYRVTQSAIELAALAPQNVRVTQSAIEFVVAGNLPQITCDNPPSGTVGNSYSHLFPASLGTPPYSWSILSGNLPDGLSLNAATGVVSGVPTVPGTFNFVIAVTDSTPRTSSIACSISIAGLGTTAGTSGARFKPCRNLGREYLTALMADQVRQERQRLEAWPYRHIFPCEGDVVVNRVADIPAPAQDGAPHVVLRYQVPSGFRLWLLGILQDGPAGLAPGDASWTVDQNSELSNSSQAMRIQGLSNIPVPLGSLDQGTVWWFPMPYDFGPLTVIRSKVTNAAVVPGAPNFFVSAFLGYLVPVLGRGEES